MEARRKAEEEARKQVEEEARKAEEARKQAELAKKRAALTPIVQRKHQNIQAIGLHRWHANTKAANMTGNFVLNIERYWLRFGFVRWCFCAMQRPMIRGVQQPSSAYSHQRSPPKRNARDVGRERKPHRGPMRSNQRSWKNSQRSEGNDSPHNVAGAHMGGGAHAHSSRQDRHHNRAAAFADDGQVLGLSVSPRAQQLAADGRQKQKHSRTWTHAHRSEGNSSPRSRSAGPSSSTYRQTASGPSNGSGSGSGSTSRRREKEKQQQGGMSMQPYRLSSEAGPVHKREVETMFNYDGDAILQNLEHDVGASFGHAREHTSVNFVLDWTPQDVTNWLFKTVLQEIPVARRQQSLLNGKQLLAHSQQSLED